MLRLKSTAEAEERDRVIKFTVQFPAHGSKAHARDTVNRIKRYLEVELQREIVVTGRRYG